MKKIANYVSLGRYKTGGVVGAGSNQHIIKNKKEWEAIVVVIANWLEPLTSEQVLDKCIQKYTQFNKADLLPAIEFVIKQNLLIEDDAYDPLDRYSRNKLFYNFNGANPETVQERLEKSKITIIGCGGIGNHVSAILATAGVGTIALVDDDVVELSNLTRQVLFTEQDVGSYKVDVLKRELQKRNSAITVETMKKQLQSIEDFDAIEPSDMYVISADHPFQLMEWANKHCVNRKQPYINVGYINDISLVGPFYIPDQTACFACVQVTPDMVRNDPLEEELKLVHAQFKPATFAPVNNIAAAFAANEIIKFLGAFGEIQSLNKRVGIYSDRLKIETQVMSRNPDCTVCTKTSNA